MRRLFLSLAICTLLLLLAGGSQAWAGDEPSAEGVRFFESKIRPLLAAKCYDCHGAETQEHELRLDTLSGMLQGGKAGAAVVAGKPKQSLLVTAVTYDDAELRMPPDEKLSKQEIADLTRWVQMGAPHPDSEKVKLQPRKTEINFEEERRFWAFQPPRQAPLPAIERLAGTQNPIDRFILAELESAGISPVAGSDKRTLIRRATFDLIGLPPTPREVADFLSDDSPQAFAHLVDRLLDSPHYGERWARHWMDVARYADSNGLDENVAHGNAWKYRDYIVESFNNDKPIDRFMVEQLAGDLLPYEDLAQQHEQLIATGFLSLGPKVLAEVDETKMEMDIVDEQIDTFGRAFLGLTLGCARCHAHKFDPIGSEDYYALAGIFRSTKTMQSFKKVAKWWENPLPTEESLARKKQYEQRVAEQKQAIEQLTQQANEQLKEQGGPDFQLPEKPEKQYPPETQAQLKKLREELAKLEKSPPEQPSAMGVVEGDAANAAIHIRGSHLTLGDEIPRGVPRVLLSEQLLEVPEDRSGRLAMARWLVSEENPLTARVFVNRIWRWHFGRGIVPTTDNFGRLGERPSNQRLLDWLTVEFQKSGWSLKSLHRRIMHSATYRTSSNYDAAAAAVDPENRLRWRWDVRRLEAEAVRDSLLMVSGQLDPKVGGPANLGVGNREYFFNHTSEDATSYDSPRRSLYLPVVRNNLYEVFTLFDYSDASVLNGNRSATVVAPQALFLMNSQAVSEASKKMAARLLEQAELSNEQRVRSLYEAAYARAPTSRELQRAIQFIGRFGKTVGDAEDSAKKKPTAWSSLCQVVLAANEFVYLR